MLTNLEWLQEGKQFPPKGEEARLARYIQNKLIFENEHNKVYTDQLKRIERVIGNMSDVISFPIVLNFQKKISLKTADFLFTEPPILTGAAAAQTETLNQIKIESELFDIGYQSVLDFSMLGTGLFKIDVVNDQETQGKKGTISISNPQYLFTIVEKEDLKKTTQYVLAWTYVVKETDSHKDENLIAYIHSKGTYERREYTMTREGKIGNLIEATPAKKTGLDDFAVIPFHNVLTSARIYGIDDYADIDSIVSELEIRTAQISKILDVFASPTVSGSKAALSKRENGEYYFPPGNFYGRGSTDEPPLEYITWDADLKSNFDQIERLINYLSTISEMGATLFNAELNFGNAPSGTALRMLYLNVLAKISRARRSIDTGLKKALSLASSIGYSKIEIKDIAITWQDGLPNDPKEIAEIITSRTAGLQTLSRKTALKKYDGLTESAAEEELEVIQEEEMAAMPMAEPPTGEPDNTEDDPGEE